LHFLKSDRHISAFSVQAQEVLAEAVQTAFRNLVNCFRLELSQTLNQFLSETIDHDSAAGLVLTVLGSAMALLRRCRVNAALTIQLFSQLFHYINVICFNTVSELQRLNCPTNLLFNYTICNLHLWFWYFGFFTDCGQFAHVHRRVGQSDDGTLAAVGIVGRTPGAGIGRRLPFGQDQSMCTVFAGTQIICGGNPTIGLLLFPSELPTNERTSPAGKYSTQSG